MTRRRAPILLTALLLLTALPATAAPALGRDPGEGVSRARHEQVVAYWTAARIRTAVPRDFIRAQNGTFKPRAKPHGVGSVAGRAWPNGQGQIYRATGKVFFSMAGFNYVCSGSVAADGNIANGRSVVLTAAHCAYDEVNHQFATNWLFIPQYDGQTAGPPGVCASTPYGCWTASSLVVHNGYATAGGFNSQATVHDFAFAVVGTGTKGTQLDASVGSYAVTTAGLRGEKRYAFGYPAEGKYKGDDLTYCAGNTFEDANNGRLTWGITCDMTGGSSGGPWLRVFDESTGVGALASVNSYGYSGVKAMHGPKFNQDTLDVYNAAKSATTSTIVH